MLKTRQRWTRQQLLIVTRLYCQIPFGKLHSRNLEIIKYAEYINRTPSALAMKLSNMASLDPAITSTGRKGLTGASQADRDIWSEMQEDWDNFVLESDRAIVEITGTTLTILDDEETVEDCTGQDKLIQSKTRIGQTFFRHTVLSAYNNTCCITGLTDKRLLVASHIIPWSKDTKNRLNPRNGLLLSMLHDKAFDLGIITIDEDMTVRVSNKNTATDMYFNQTIKAYNGKSISLPDKFQPDINFLSYHRENIYEC